MNENKILHVMILDKFLAPFIDFVDENFGRDNHHYVFITSEKYEYGLTPEHKVEFLYTDDDIFITLLKYMKMSKKIILHGLWRDKVDILLYFNQELLKKCYWVMWGGDFYFPEKQTWFRNQIIKNIKNYIVSNQNDIKYIQQNYNTLAESVYFSQLYPICISYIENDLKLNTNNSLIKILVGNSATDTNRHEEIFDLLEKYKDCDIEIVVPLNYGSEEYRVKTIDLGHKIFDEKFKPIIDFINFEEYKKILQNIDIGIFNHNRQQAGANIKLLAGYGKKLYISKENSFYHELKNDGIIVYDIENFDCKKICHDIAMKNKKIALEKYSLQVLLKSWIDIFNSK
ncbi:TDP-N-acetylfucosamine:lipid II N-acetylfucosaminyltransferase [Aliarcobacter cryaerophilus]|uniref:TDP-N-acetylfucosamine:lipid II N-acetylfucosaminyltransferase n=1 Tax=Aliarcobacter cryaerophilus TaxID=28198 RepID=UPI003DA425B0